MIPSQGQQLEKLMDEAQKRGDFSALEELLRDDSRELAPPKCSKQFVTKLDKLINKELNEGNVKNVTLCLSCLLRAGQTLFVPGGPLASGNGAQGLVKKWYAKALRLWVDGGQHRNEMLLSLAEDFFDALMVVHEASNEGRYQVTESFLLPIGLLASDSRVHVMIQKEAVRKLNLILDKIPPALKKERKILSTEEVSVAMTKLAHRILEGGDYDLQVALMEALCRMTSRAQRQELANSWFTMEFICSAFCSIQDSEFETDCRKFLNLVNGMQGDERRVYSYPCLEVFLGKHELLMPMDEKLEEFWIDFNLGSESISFYFCLSKDDSQEGHWDTICVPENEVFSYTVEGAGGRTVLTVTLTEPLSVGWAEGSALQFHFSSSLDVLRAAGLVYGDGKRKKFVGKKSSSVVKTTVQIILDESNSQPLVPESQLSQGGAELHPCASESIVSLPPLPHPEGTAGRPLPTPDHQHPLQAETPARRKVSESSTFIAGAGRSTGVSPCISVGPAVTPAVRAKVKPSLELVSSCGRKREFAIRELMMAQTPESPYCSVRREQIDAIGSFGGRSSMQNCASGPPEKFHRTIPVDRVVAMVQAEPGSEQQCLDNSLNVVPDTQPVWSNRTPPVLPGAAVGEASRRRPSESELTLQVQRSLPTGRAPPSPPPPAPPLGVSSAPSQDQSTQLFPAVAQQKRPGSAQLHTQLTRRLEGLFREQQRAGGPAEQQEEQQQEEQGAGAVSRPKGRALEPEQGGDAQKSGRKSCLSTPAQPESSTGASARSKKPQKATTVEVTSNMMRFISSQYKISTAVPWCTPTSARRSNSGKSWACPSMEKGAAEVSGLAKKASGAKTPADRPECDVFSFTSESPKSSRQKGLQSLEKSGADKRVKLASSCTTPSARTSTAAKPRGNFARKHLFSDTETEKTDISWLRESGRKPKPRVLDYSRQRCAPKPPPHADSAYESDLPPPSAKPSEKQPKRKQKQRKNTKETETKRVAADCKLSGRPQRSTASSKNYREASDSGSSQSECDEPTNHRPKPAQTNLSTKWSEMHQRPEQPGQSPAPEEERREEPITTGKSGHVALTASQRGAKPVTAGERGQDAVTAGKSRKRPAVANRQRNKLVTAKEYGKHPVTASEEVEMPVTADRLLKEPVAASESEKKPVPAKKKVDEPVAASGQARNPVAANERGIKSVVAEDQTGGQKGSWSARLTDFALSPPPMERMRSAAGELEALSEWLVSPVHSPDTLPLPLEEAPPFKGIQASSFYRADGGNSKRRSPNAPSLCPLGQAVPTPVPSPLHPLQTASPPLLTSTALEPSVPNSPLLEESLGVLPESQGLPAVLESFRSSSSLRSISLPKKGSPNEYKENAQLKVHKSGPGRKRPPSRHVSCVSDEEEEEEEEEEDAPGPGTEPRISMRPRKLFRASEEEEGDEGDSLGCSWTEKDKVSQKREATAAPGQEQSISEAEANVEVCSMMSSRVVSSFWGSNTEAEGDAEAPEFSTSQYMSSICRQFSTELQRKMQSRSRRMDQFAKQSLKSVQQHVSSVSVQIHQCRSQKLEKIRDVLLEEIQSLEQDNSKLKDMEKELTAYWRQQAQALRSHQERESRRLQNLKSVFQKNASHSLEFEEQIFTSEMCLMREDMKAAQDKLFKEMQEEEMLSVRRGLQALFLPDGCGF